MSQNGVKVYAEFLLNISQVTIFATLDLTGSDEDETAHFFSDRKRIEITYAGSSAAITYPNGISGTAVVHLPIKAAAQVSLRLEITEKGDPYWKNALETLNDSPWAASAFSQTTIVACRQCRSIFCDEGVVQVWKDLPRGDWAETMDLWHCHKPSDPAHKSDDGIRPRFDRSGIPAPRAGTALIDATDLILYQPDTKSLKITNNQQSQAVLTCGGCRATVGFEGINNDNEFRLHKWKLTTKKHADAEWETNDIQSLLCVQLLELIDSQGSKRFLLKSGSEAENAVSLLIWVLNPDLKYCASYVGDGYPRRAIKVLYKDVDPGSSDEGSDTSDSSLELTEGVLAETRRCLVESNGMMPAAARKVQGWTAGLLERFNPIDISVETASSETALT